MKMIRIKSIEVFKIDLPLKEGNYSWSHGNSVNSFDSTIVKINTNIGISGLGEVCTLGPAYLPAYAEGVRTGIKQIGKYLIRKDPTDLQEINLEMDKNLKGHNYVKSPIDIACWDITSKVMQVPLWKLLGGKFGKSVDLYRAISQESPKAMTKKVIKYQKEGYRKFQLKVGGDPIEDIERIKLIRSKLKNNEILVADANTGWLMHDALKVVKETNHLNIYIEQPCLTYEENLIVRDKCNNPFILDENIDSISTTNLIMLFSPKKLNLFLAVNLPSAFLCGVRVKLINTERCCVSVRHKWINKNPFSSVFWAVQGMAAELSTGALIILKIKQLNQKISMLVLRNEAQFTKKAKGRITFECKQGISIDSALKKAIETGQGQTLILEAEGHDEAGDLVSKFSFEWTLKTKF